MALAKLPISYPESLDAIAEIPDHKQAGVLAVEDPQPDALGDALVELGRNLSPDASWALVNIAGRIAEGATEYQALRESRNGVGYGEAKRRLELLREELSGEIA